MTPQRALAWVFLTGILVVAADFESTAQLAEAIAILIMVSVFIVYGEKAFSNMVRLTSPGAVTSTSSTTEGYRGDPGFAPR